MKMMRHILICGAVRGAEDGLKQLQQWVHARRPDGVLLDGSILEDQRPSRAGRTARAARWYEYFFKALGALDTFTAVVPGTADAPLHEFLRAAMHAEIAFPNIHIAHATPVEEGDIAVCGIGGRLTEQNDRFEEDVSYSRASAEYFFRLLWKAEQPRKILLLNDPPPGRLGGEAGNPITGEFVESYHPSLCVVSGETARRGTQRIAHSLIVNAGQLADGSAAWLDWESPPERQVEFLP